MATTNVPASTESPPSVDDGNACEACTHPLNTHDGLGLRFCAATVAAALSRGCICR